MLTPEVKTKTNQQTKKSFVMLMNIEQSLEEPYPRLGIPGFSQKETGKRTRMDLDSQHIRSWELDGIGQD